ncbi:MAG: tetratricopeptide repeat protein [Nitrospirales bacterium]|nr:tetratricopeptide repeat protein [Nitrospirales bacterium]
MSIEVLKAEVPEGPVSPALSVEDFSEAHLRLGIDFFLTDELEIAIGEFQEAIRQRPGYAKAYHNLGVTLAKTGDLAGAVVAWTEAERLDPRVVSTRYRISALVAYNYGVSLLRAKRMPDAMDQWQLAIRLQPDLVEAHYALGMGYVTAKNPLPALAHFRHARDWAPDWGKAYEGLGLAHYESHDYALARDAWLHARDLLSNAAGIHAYLGLLAVQEGNYQQAIDYSRQALELQPTLASAHFNLGMALFRKGEEEASLEPLKTAWKLDPSLTSAPLVMGVVKSHQGHWSSAASLWEKALRRNPSNPERMWLRFNRGVALTMLGNPQDAALEFRLVVQGQPEWIPGWTRLGHVYMGLHQWEQASKVFQRAVELDPRSGNLHYVLGRVLLEQGRLGEAEQAFRHAVEKESSFMEAQYQLGLVLRAQNRQAEAVEPLRRAAEGGSVQAQDLLASMYANGSGVDRNLSLAMLWWFGDVERIEESANRSDGHRELSRLRGELFGQRLSAADRQDVLTGFALIRQQLTQPNSSSLFSSMLMNGEPNWQSLQPSDAVLPWVIQMALALDGQAQETLARWYEQGSSGEVNQVERRIQNYFLQTGKEGNVHSCQVIQRQIHGRLRASFTDASALEIAGRNCQAVSSASQLTQKQP